MTTNNIATARSRRCSLYTLAIAGILSLCGSFANAAAAGLGGNPDVKSSFVVVVDAADSSVLYARQADLVVPVASITKLMTALVVLDAAQPMDELIEITTEDRDTEKGTGSRLGFGTKLSRGDLLLLALMSSENRAAHALGRHYPGGLPTFLEAMNARAEDLGMTSTRFVDPTGLSSGNVSTASDLAKLVIAAGRDPLIRELSIQESHTVTVGKQQLEFRNTNLLVSKPEWEIAVQKTGYTLDAGRCLVMQTLIHGKPVVMVLLNSFGTLTRVADARRIRRWMESHPGLLQASHGGGGGGGQLAMSDASAR